MVNYQKGKIYKIISPHTDKCYVGSTTKDLLCNRLARHVYDSKKNLGSSRKIIQLGDYEIVLLELYPCNSKDELHARERHYIETLDCVNIAVPGRTSKEYKEDHKEEYVNYRLSIKDYLAECAKKYYLNNKHLKNKKVKCECGCSISKQNLSTHKKSNKHIKLMESQSSL